MVTKSYKPTTKKYKNALITYRLQKFRAKINQHVQIQKESMQGLLTNTEKAIQSTEELYTRYFNLAHISAKIEGKLQEKAKGIDWEPIKAKAEHLAQKECAICFGELNHKKNTLLSCGHTFHHNCMQSLEKYDINKCMKCPICRELYCRIAIEDKPIIM